VELWLDVDEFERQITQHEIACLEPPVALYRGDFLEGFYDDWCLDESYRLEALYLRTLEQLVAAYVTLDQPGEVLCYVELLLARDPLREDVHRTAIGLHVRLGKPAEAVRQARWCRAVLARWRRAKSGRGHVILVSGEAGIGKSRLVEELVQHVRRALLARVVGLRAALAWSDWSRPEWRCGHVHRPEGDECVRARSRRHD
jgi:hypothetical protein